MEILIWIGAGLTLLGVLGLLLCVLLALRAKRSSLGEEAIKSALQKVVALNLGALLLSGLGLMAVVTGIERNRNIPSLYRSWITFNLNKIEGNPHYG